MIKLLNISLILLRYFHYGYDRSYNSRPMTPEEKLSTTIGVSIVLLLVAGFIIWMVYRKMAVKRKKQKVENFINEFKKSDPFWNEGEMLEIANELFLNVQYAWMKKSFNTIGDYITVEMKSKWENTWSQMIEKNIGFQCGKIEMKSVTIVGAEDSANNDYDTFSVEISAYLKRYMYHRSTMAVLSGYTNQLEYITDVYTFVRRENKWKLSDINYNASLNEVLSQQINFEKPGKPGKPNKV